MIEISGASDDLVEVEGDSPGADEYSGDRARILVGTVEAGVIVTMRYGGKDAGAGFACWSAEISQPDEGVPIPWDVTVTHTPGRGAKYDEERAGYSVLVRVACPPATPIVVTMLWAEQGS